MMYEVKKAATLHDRHLLHVTAVRTNTTICI